MSEKTDAVSLLFRARKSLFLAYDFFDNFFSLLPAGDNWQLCPILARPKYTFGYRVQSGLAYGGSY